ILQMRAFLGGQLEALDRFGHEELAAPPAVQEHEVPIITEEEAAAIAALDKELSAFAAATAPPEESVPVSEPPVREEAPAEEPPEDGAEVLVGRQLPRSREA
ncbi:MAG TPA: hypothetical protein PLV10_09065, partial [Candidatus Latescibacteria bacterium]|nr:hypothetical protein [Candidatus Latescibacterota bacterium]